MTFVVLDPTAGPTAAPARPAPRLASLEGARVGLLDNGKVKVAPFLDAVEEILRSRYGVADVRRRRKSNVSAPAPPGIVRDLSACDAVVSAVGD